jgi:hypothetical protein
MKIFASTMVQHSAFSVQGQVSTADVDLIDYARGRDACS